MNKKLVLAGLFVMSGLAGCAGIDTLAKNTIKNKESGVIYGVSGLSMTDGENEAKKMCESVQNNDFRCKEVENYVGVGVVSSFGFSGGGVGTLALVNKNFPNLYKMSYSGRLGDKNETYVKAKVVAGQFGEVLEIVSTDGDGKCHWSGMPRAGGTVCPAYNYDYRKDFNGIPR